MRPAGLVCLLTLLLLPLSVTAQAVEPILAPAAEQDEAFWVQWNRFVNDLVRREMEQPDPWEDFNRKIFAFNDFVDRYTLKPASKAYQWITPDPVERGVANVFSNLLEITTIVNDLLQFKFTQAASDTGRFVINTTVGLGGIFDVASPIGLTKNDEDFGQTLGYWGMGSGPYLVVPFFGSYTLRDGFGAYLDVYSDVLAEVDHIPSRNQIVILRYIDKRVGLFAAEELITGDRYAFIRDAYLQRREYLVNDGVVQDTFGDEDWEEGWQDGWDEE